MKNLILLSALFATACSANQKATVEIFGLVSGNSHGLVTILDCTTQKEITLGVMASNPYFRFITKVDELEKEGSVLVKATGYLDKQGNTLNRPRILKVKSGSCSNSST